MNLILISLTTTVLMIIQKQNCFDVDIINADHPNKIVDIIDNSKHKDTIIDNNKHKNTLSHKSYSTICDELYNVMKKKENNIHICCWYAIGNENGTIF